jgi:hypothetical protein
VILNDEGREARWVTAAGARDLPLNTPTRILLEAVMASRGDEGTSRCRKR